MSRKRRTEAIGPFAFVLRPRVRRLSPARVLVAVALLAALAHVLYAVRAW